MWIYCITNKTTGKKYIGKTKRPVSTRWASHCYDAFKRQLDTHFARALRQHGKNDFIIEVVEECADVCHLSERERFWIESFDTYHNGYNSTKGGDGGLGIKWSEEAKKRQSKNRIGMKFSEEHKTNLSKSHQGKPPWNKGLATIDNPLTGRCRSKEVCLRISQGKFKKVQQISLDGKLIAVFESIKEAALILGIQSQNITKCCKGLRTKTGGYRWSYV
jgi:group I intron endonuclease